MSGEVYHQVVDGVIYPVRRHSTQAVLRFAEQQLALQQQQQQETSGQLDDTPTGVEPGQPAGQYE